MAPRPYLRWPHRASPSHPSKTSSTNSSSSLASPPHRRSSPTLQTTTPRPINFRTRSRDPRHSSGRLSATLSSSPRKLGRQASDSHMCKSKASTSSGMKCTLTFVYSNAFRYVHQLHTTTPPHHQLISSLAHQLISSSAHQLTSSFLQMQITNSWRRCCTVLARSTKAPLGCKRRTARLIAIAL